MSERESADRENKMSFIQKNWDRLSDEEIQQILTTGDDFYQRLYSSAEQNAAQKHQLTDEQKTHLNGLRAEIQDTGIKNVYGEGPGTPNMHPHLKETEKMIAQLRALRAEFQPPPPKGGCMTFGLLRFFNKK